MKYACFLSTNGPAAIDQAYSAEVRERIRNDFKLLDPLYTAEAPGDVYRECRILFTTWGCPAWDASFLQKYFPKLEALFYAAGSVQAFARGYMERGVRIFAAPAVNAVPVADYCLAQIILASKGYFQLTRQRSKMSMAEARAAAKHYAGSYGTRIGLIGFGQIARLLTRKIHAVLADADIAVYDPYVTDEVLEAYGAARAELDEVFRRSEIVSNHLPNLPDTVHMLNEQHFQLLPPYASFLNTGRGAQIVEEDLIKVLTERPDLTALLDVTDPEPPAEDSPFYRLSNVFLTPHIAGSSGREIQRMGAAVYAACRDWMAGRDSDLEVSLEQLKHMA